MGVPAREKILSPYEYFFCCCTPFQVLIVKGGAGQLGHPPTYAPGSVLTLASLLERCQPLFIE